MLDRVVEGIQEKLVMLSLVSHCELIKDPNFCDYGIIVNGEPKLIFTFRSYRTFYKKYQLIPYKAGTLMTNTDCFSNEEDLLKRVLEILDEIIKEVA